MRLSRLPLCLLLASIACVSMLLPGRGSAAPADGTPPAAVAPDVTAALQSSPSVRVIVSLRATAGSQPRGLDVAARRAAVASASGRVKAATQAAGFTATKEYDVVPAIAGVADAAGVDALAHQPDVLSVALDGQVHADLTQVVPLINADDVHTMGLTGAGVVVAVLDTGVDTDHPLLAGSIVHQECYLTLPAICPGGPNVAEDGNSHGTHVSGIITSNGPPVGIAPDAGILAIKVLDNSGNGQFSDILFAYDHIETSHPEVDIINMSISDGGSYFTGTCDSGLPALTTSIADTRAMGMTTFAAAGNNGSKHGIGYPACVTGVVSVGATYDANVGSASYSACSDPTTAVDQITCFSQSEPSLDLLAPGAYVESSVVGGGTANFVGTTMASPAAAAVAALLEQDEPGLTPDQVEARLTSTGVEITDPANGVSSCRVDALAAVTDNDGGTPCPTPGGCPDNDALGGPFGGTVPPAPPWINDGVGPEGANSGCDAADINDDNDRSCTDAEELGGNLNLGGGRNPMNPWDFADVPSPALPLAGTRNGAVTLSDVGAALVWVGRTLLNGVDANGHRYIDDNNANGVHDGAEYDRTPAGAVTGPPNGAVSLADVGAILNQVGDSCTAAPN
jgi:subtilisin family serine protease